MLIGLISDTHGHLDPRVKPALAGVRHILHAGDIGLPWLLLELETDVAPVTAVLGNVDDGLPYRPTEVVEFAGKKLLLHHIVDPQRPAPEFARLLAKHRPDVVVFGHTHRPFCETIGGTLFINPGSAGRPRFSLAPSLAVLDLAAARLEPRFIELNEGGQEAPRAGVREVLG